MSFLGKKLLVCGTVTVASVGLSLGLSQAHANAATNLSSIPRTFRGTWYENDGYSKEKFKISSKHMTFYQYSHGKYKKYGTYAVSKKFQAGKRKVAFTKHKHGWYSYSLMDANGDSPMKKATVKIAGKKYTAILTNGGGQVGLMPKHQKYDLMLHHATNHHYQQMASTSGSRS